MPFGKSRPSARDVAWRELAEQRGGDVVNDRRGRATGVRSNHRAWTIVLDTYTVSNGETSQTFTRLHALFLTRTPFRLKLYRENFLHRIGKLLGMQDVTVGIPDLDREFIIRTTNESIVRSLVTHPRVHRALLAQPAGRLEAAPFRRRRRPPPEHTAELRFVTPGVVTDSERLLALHELMAAALDQLASIGVAALERINYEF